jgi:hypothetical protein
MRTCGVLALAALVAIAAAGCRRGSEPKPGEPSVVDRAIEAAGGAANLGAIRSIESRSRGAQLGRSYRAVVQRILPDRYRHDVEVSDAHYVQATDGADIWATLDDYAVPVHPDEEEALRLSWRLSQISTLLPLKSVADLKVREEREDDGRAVVRITFPPDSRRPASHRGPYTLHFDGATSLLRQIDFEAVIFGADRERPTRIELLDYRRVDGVMVPFEERISVAGKLEQEERIEQVLINPSIDLSRFRRPEPPRDLVIRDRTAAEVTVAILEQRSPRPEAAADAEADLARYLAKHDLVPNGPSFRLQPVAERDVPAVGVPILPPPPETRPASRPATREQARIAELPRRRVLTTVIPADDPAARSAAIERLLAHAGAAGLEPAGPCKIVLWSAEVVQLQLPVGPRNE